MGAPQRKLSIADVLGLIKGFSLSDARARFGSVYLGQEGLIRSFQAKNDKQKAYDKARLRKGFSNGDLHQKLFGESVLQRISASYAPMARLSRLLREEHSQIDLNAFYHAWHSYMAIPFDHAEDFTPFQREKLDWHSRAIYHALVARAHCEFGPLLDETLDPNTENGPTRVAITLTQFLGRRHAPTSAAIIMADALLSMGHTVKILNQSLTPRRAASGFYAPGIAPKLAELDTVGRLDTASGSVDFWQNSEDDVSVAGLTGYLDALKAFAPTHIISLGPGNLYSDLAGKHIPHIAMPTTASLTLGRPGAYATVQPNTALQLRLFARLGIDPQRIVPVPSNFKLPEPTHPVTRAHYGMTEQNYGVAIVSNRMASEISDSFFGQLATTLEALPRCKVVFFGAPAGCNETLKQKISTHPQMAFAGFSEDLASTLSVFDAVLNPPRFGGGTSAAYAMAHGLNVFTLPDCDVATVTGPAFVHPSMDAVFEGLSSAYGDNAVQAEARELALERWKDLADQTKPTQILLDHARKDKP